ELEERVVAEAMELLKQGNKGVNAAALLLERNLGRRMARYFERCKVHPDDVEELVNELWFKIVTSDAEERVVPVAWMWRVASNVMRDWYRRRRAVTGEAANTVGLDVEDWLALMETYGAKAPPPWLRLCLERAMWQLEQDDPGRAEVLRMVCDGWTDIEIAVYFGADPDRIDKQTKNNARDRVYRARKKAAEYFSACKE
ncbi:MAG: hypothetical protein JNJ60_12585, partial [Rhodocyclaceae bacterium]|nr:hypothetical protein [Rhodocyclaceae bacterium]